MSFLVLPSTLFLAIALCAPSSALAVVSITQPQAVDAALQFVKSTRPESLPEREYTGSAEWLTYPQLPHILYSAAEKNAWLNLLKGRSYWSVTLKTLPFAYGGNRSATHAITPILVDAATGRVLQLETSAVLPTEKP